MAVKIFAHGAVAGQNTDFAFFRILPLFLVRRFLKTTGPPYRQACLVHVLRNEGIIVKIAINMPGNSVFCSAVIKITSPGTQRQTVFFFRGFKGKSCTAAKTHICTALCHKTADSVQTFGREQIGFLFAGTAGHNQYFKILFA